jgi:hypothetical protein
MTGAGIISRVNIADLEPFGYVQAGTDKPTQYTSEGTDHWILITDHCHYLSFVHMLTNFCLGDQHSTP